MRTLLVHDPGPLATIQDLGRHGRQRFGVAVAGAIDPFAFRAANALVDNPPDHAAIEFTLAGGQYEIEHGDAHLAVAGGAFALSIDGRAMAPWRSFVLRPGERLTVGGAPDAARGYLAVDGGFDVPPVLGSRSTHVRSGIGGWQGRALRSGDRLPAGAPRPPGGGDRVLPADAIPAKASVVRMVLGPQDDHFDPPAIAAFFAATYTVTREADRMGYRLEGPPIAHAGNDNIVSDGIALGSVQIPGNGLPIILLADRQPTGGYPKIGTVIGPDLRAIAQARPGDTLRFQRIDRAPAHRARVEWQMRLDGIPAAVRAGEEGDRYDSRRLLTLNLVSGVIAEGEL